VVLFSVLDVNRKPWPCLGRRSHLNGVADTPELCAAYNAARPRHRLLTPGAADERLYAKYKAIDAQPE
jgi:oligopeptidase A